MLRECAEVRQNPKEGFRRWFIDPDFDLIVWYAGSGGLGEITGFQLCYDKRANDEHAMTWRLRGGVTHSRVEGDASPSRSFGPAYRGSPVLVPDGPLPAVSLRDRFAAAARDIDPAVSGLVRRVLDELAAEALAPPLHGEH